MPELPDVTIYVEALIRLIGGRRLEKIDLRSPFLIRSVEPDVFLAEGKLVTGISRQGKRIIWHLEDELYLVFHLMIAGRFHCRKPDARARGKNDLAAFRFEHTTLMLTEASTKKRAGLWAVRGVKDLESHDPGGLEPLDCTAKEFREAVLRENRTLKRALTNPRNFSGIGNAYSDEILHAAGLSPLLQTHRLDDEQVERLYQATRTTLEQWTKRLRRQTGNRFPEKVTAFRKEMAVHGKYGETCPTCKTPVQRIVYAENETNYCPTCQTGGTVLKDRSLSRLLKNDWPRTVEEWEAG